MNYILSGSSVHGILQARILEWVTMSFSRGSSWSRDQTHITFHLLHWQVGSLPLVPPGKPRCSISGVCGYYHACTCLESVLTSYTSVMASQPDHEFSKGRDMAHTPSVPLTPSHNAQFHERHTMDANQYFPIGFEDPDYRALLLTVSSPEAMMMAKFTIRLQPQTVCVLEASRSTQPEGVHLPPSTSGLQETHIALSKSCFGWKFRTFSYLRIHLEWIQPEQLKKMWACSVQNREKCWYFNVQWWKEMSQVPDLYPLPTWL